MDARDIVLGDLDRAAVTEFLDALRAAGRRCVPGAHGLDRLLEYLEDQGVLDGHSSSAAPLEVLAERYRRWLVTDRGLAEATVVRYVKLARSFLNQRLTGRGELESLSGTDIVAFLLAESERLSVGSVKGRVGELRSLLRFLWKQERAIRLSSRAARLLYRRPVKPQVRLADGEPGNGAADDHPLDFAGALEDREDLRVAVPALNGVLPGITVTAQDLDGLLGDADRRLPRDQLAH